MYLDNDEAGAIEAQVASIEQRTGVQIVAAIVDKADIYAELPWKAFALGVAMATLAVVAADWLRPDWVTSRAAVVHAIVVLGVGGVSALLAMFVPAYAHVYLRPARRDNEVRRYAQSLFLRRELFNTHDRNAVLILVSEFERKVEIIADVGLSTTVTAAEWRAVIARMSSSLAARRYAAALQDGLTAVADLLVAKGLRGRAGAVNELPDRPIETAGGR
jgi:putative membrane protein